MRCYQTILVVEDEKDDQILLQSAFRANGVTCPIEFVSNGTEAVAYLMGEGHFADREKHPYPSMIITDLKMQGGDGLDVLEHLRNNPDWQIIPTVVLSASDDPADVETAYRLGASCFHVKPTSFPALRHLAKQLHDYWLACVVPQCDSTGRHVLCQDKGKLGERFPHPPPESRQKHPRPH